MKRTEPSRRVLVAGGSASARKKLEASLAVEGYEVASTGNGHEALRTLHDPSRPDIFVVDVVLAPRDGYWLCRVIRESDPTASVILLSWATSEEDAVAALEAGADDFVRKPMRARELAARIQANLRARAAGLKAPKVLEFEDLRIDTGSQEVFVKGKYVPLRRKEFWLLASLAERAGQLVTHEDLIRKVWDRPDNKSRTLSVHLAHLRAAIEKPSDYTYVQTVIKVGYRFAPLPKDPARVETLARLRG
jgi:two-component system KDP operon response regulator KdpE